MVLEVNIWNGKLFRYSKSNCDIATAYVGGFVGSERQSLGGPSGMTGVYVAGVLGIVCIGLCVVCVCVCFLSFY